MTVNAPRHGTAWAAPLAAVAALALLAGAHARADEPFKTVSAAEVEQLLGRPGVHVFDANARGVFEEGHVPGARLVHYKKLSEADLPADRSAQLIFYCKNPH
jgi:3-mercaptopyruvate sulfurtransferase SseA